ncbi:MAG TPA: hypothetical protein VL069_12785, partial [Opitutus sp.]|nr:hypothetical protein [Opitutus sp.]
REEGRAWSISLAIIVVLSAAWPTWWLGSSFGYRGLEVATLFVMIGIAVLMQASRQQPILRRALSTCVGIAVIWNLALLALFLTQRIPREEPVTHRQTLHALREWVAGQR